MEEIYIRTDGEANGPIPRQNSMLSFGSAAYTKDKLLDATEVEERALPANKLHTNSIVILAEG